MALCNTNGCRLLVEHSGAHNKYPTSAWNFFDNKDKKKINKAGFATPRGGKKGAYQNHVTRNNKVIIPYEKFDPAAIPIYEDGYVVRLYPEQFFETPNHPKHSFIQTGSPIQIGVNAFILYRTWESFELYPPMPEWSIRGLTRNEELANSRGQGVIDTGHYVLRLSTHGNNPERNDGPPQGIFATEYADEQTNYLCKCVLAFFIVNTLNSPYTTSQTNHLRLILESAGLLNYEFFEQNGTMRRNHTCCPLCQKIIGYNELHETIFFDESEALVNAATQVEGATRSTIVNLFHLKPLIYHSLTHIPANIGWGHAICNTYLAQRECLSLHELIQNGLKVGIIYEDHNETFGWISDDFKFIRSPNGAVWIQISRDMPSDELNTNQNESSE